MLKELSWKVGGQQGEGIESTGELFSTALNRQGYFLNSFRHFSSRIKGGHTNNKIRVRTKPTFTISDETHILVAFDQETINLNHGELVSGGIVMADSKFNPEKPEGCHCELYSVPFTEIASDLGLALMKNMVAVGATAALMDLDISIFSDVVQEVYGRKGEAVVQKNVDAIKAGKEYMEKIVGNAPFKLEPTTKAERMYIAGNEAIGMGCIVGGARFMGGYPITPATEVMEYLTKHLPKVGGTVIQTEDEIAAVMTTIGANFAGVRSVTSTSGPGLSLMAEAIGLAGISEVPLVIVDVQRGGPSTGLPSKTEQSDVMAAIHNAHGEIPKIVIAPSTVEEAFYDAAEAFNLAEEYQCPVILLIDMQMGAGKQTIEKFDLDKVEIRRGALVSEPITTDDPSKYFKRYEVTESGVSPRTIPGMLNGIHHVTGVEHDEMGKPAEAIGNRIAQMDKRLRKLDYVKFDQPIHIHAPHDEADVLFVGFNSSRGAIEDTIAKFAEEGIKANHAHVRLIHPFPVKEMEPLMQSAKKVFVVESNATGQLASIMKLSLPQYADKVQNILQYDGTPILFNGVYNKSKEMI